MSGFPRVAGGSRSCLLSRARGRRRGPAPPLEAAGRRPQGRVRAAEVARGHLAGPGGPRAPTSGPRSSYRVASGGSVVQETLFPGSPHEMISMYHLAGGQLVMTHYCAMGNQPRMKLDTARRRRPTGWCSPSTAARTSTRRRTAMSTPAVLEWKGDSLHADWAVWAAGKEAGHNAFELRRQ